MVDLSPLREMNAAQADEALTSTKHKEVLAHTDNVAQTVLSATTALIQYLEGHTSKTEVINQLDSISTPDVKYVVEALQVLDQTIKATPQVDLSQLTELMQGVLNEAKQIPKTLPEEKEQPFVDYSSQFSSLTDAIKAVEKVVKAQKLVAEAPVVNVPEVKLPTPQVHVDAPDLTPVTTEMKAVTKQVKLSADEVRQASAKTQAGLITEQFDEYKIVYDSFDDSEPVIKGIKYLLNGKVVANLKYSYDAKGNLLGGKKL